MLGLNDMYIVILYNRRQTKNSLMIWGVSDHLNVHSLSANQGREVDNKYTMKVKLRKDKPQPRFI